MYACVYIKLVVAKFMLSCNNTYSSWSVKIILHPLNTYLDVDQVCITLMLYIYSVVLRQYWIDSVRFCSLS